MHNPSAQPKEGWATIEGVGKMIRNLKALMLASMAVLAVGAMAASAANAAEFTSPNGASTITTTPDGTGKTAHHVFHYAGGTLTCNTVHDHASIGGTSATSVLTTSVAYSGNCNFVGQTATVNMNGCNYRFNASGTVDIVCPAGQEITFSVPSPVCDVVVPPQTGLSSVTFHSINANEVTVESHTTGIKYTATGAGCPETGSFSNGSCTTGNVILTAEIVGAMVPLSVDTP
jgi:hypothetical protein